MDTIAPIDMSTPRPNSIAIVIPSAIISSMEDWRATLRRLSTVKNLSVAIDIIRKIRVRINTYEYLAIKVNFFRKFSLISPV